MRWCEQNRVDYVFGMARNKRLEGLVADALGEAQQQFESTQKPARVFTEFEHETLSGSWSKRRRVVAKAEHIDGKSNPRFIVTSLAPRVGRNSSSTKSCTAPAATWRTASKSSSFCLPIA